MDLVTGATGIVGAHLVSALLASGRSVRAIARDPKKIAHLHQVLAHYGLQEHDISERLELVNVDILDVSAVNECVIGIEHLYHSAAMVSFTPHEKDLMWKVNVDGTGNLINASIATNVKRFCHVSSVASIGRDPNGEMSTENSPFEDAPHVSPYSHTKYHAELEIFRGIAEGLDAFMVNPSVIIGPGLVGQSSMAMVDKVRNGISFYPSGTAAIVDARDVAQALISGSEKARTGERYLLVGEHLPYKELFKTIAEISGTRPAKRVLPHWLLNIAWRLEATRTFFFRSHPFITKHTAHSACSHYRYDNTKAKTELGVEFRTVQKAVENAIKFRNLSA